MTLAKKTIVLSKSGAKGYVTIVRVGSSTGIKYTLDSEKKEFFLGLKIGFNPLIIKKIDKTKGEFSLDEGYDFQNSDDVSCMVVCGDKVFAEGGLRGRIQLQDMLFRINAQENAQAPINQQKEVKSQNKNEKEMEAVNGIKEKNSCDNAKAQMLNKQDNTEIEAVVQETNEKRGGVENSTDKQKISDIDLSIPKDMKGFYYSVKDKLDELFVMYPRDKQLEKIIPSSKWVRINYDKEGFYVAGVLLDDNSKVTHIAYGVPGFEGMTPPKETECICDWLPIKNMEKYQGYWLIFQSADTGEIIPKD